MVKQELPRENRWMESLPSLAGILAPWWGEVPAQLDICGDFVAAQMGGHTFWQERMQCICLDYWRAQTVIRLFVLRQSEQSLIPKDKAKQSRWNSHMEKWDIKRPYILLNQFLNSQFRRLVEKPEWWIYIIFTENNSQSKKIPAVFSFICMTTSPGTYASSSDIAAPQSSYFNFWQLVIWPLGGLSF